MPLTALIPNIQQNATNFNFQKIEIHLNNLSLSNWLIKQIKLAKTLITELIHLFIGYFGLT